MNAVHIPQQSRWSWSTFVVRIVNALIVGQVACFSATASAQVVDSVAVCATHECDRTPSATAPDIAGASSTTKRWLVASGAAVLATAAAMTVDRRSAAFMQQSRMQSSNDLQRAAKSAAFMGGPGPFLVGGSLFALGKLSGQAHVAELGAHVTEAVLLAATITAFGKGLSGRALPSSSTGDPDNFQMGRGFHKGNGPFVSFPSGHTAAAFAMAAVFTQEAALWHPGAERVIGPLAYGGGAAIGLARMYQNVHWASDLPLATLIGIWSGMKVVRHSHAGSRRLVAEHVGDGHSKRFESVVRVLQGVQVAPSAHGATIGWSLR